ncbi:MAG: hypothetical protein R3D29_15375 [Nitratireductor sp.]
MTSGNGRWPCARKPGASPSPASESRILFPPIWRAIIAEPADTAAIAAQTQAIMVPSAEDLFIFSISPEIARQSDGREILDPETYVQLALRRKGARQPRHITIGRIKGDGYEVFQVRTGTGKCHHPDRRRRTHHRL